MIIREADSEGGGAGLGPQEYLDWLRGRLVDDYVASVQLNDPIAGVRTTVESGVPMCEVADPAAYESFLARGSLSVNQIDKILAFEAEFEAELTRDRLIERARENEARMQKVREFCLDALPPEMGARVADVPVGVANAGYFYAGASPVPAGGDVVVVSSALSYLWWWSAWIRLLSAEQGALDGPRPLLGALPELAGFILAMRPFAEFELFLCEAAARPQVFQHIETERRVWFAQCFAVLHEFGHVLLGHTEKLRAGPVGAGERHGLEFEADRFAAEILRDCVVETDEQSDNDNIFAAMFELFQLLRFEELADAGGSVERSHPGAAERFEKVVGVYLDGAPNRAELTRQTMGNFALLVEISRRIHDESRRRRRRK